MCGLMQYLASMARRRAELCCCVRGQVCAHGCGCLERAPSQLWVAYHGVLNSPDELRLDADPHALACPRILFVPYSLNPPNTRFRVLMLVNLLCSRCLEAALLTHPAQA
jgi:hypothetical protein